MTQVKLGRVMERLTLSLQLHDIFLLQLLIAHDTLFSRTNEGVSTRFACYMRAGLHHCNTLISEMKVQRNIVENVPYMRVLFDNFFLHDGHMGSASSPLAFSLFPAGVESTDREEPPPLKNVNLTGIKVFILQMQR